MKIWFVGCGMLALSAFGVQALFALDGRKSFSQYSRMVWTQQQGLPQDTVTAIAQSKDGYLWLGTDEGLGRFDGYEFLTFDTATGSLPSNSVKALALARDDSLWIGTTGGLVHLTGNRSRIYKTSDGLPDNSIDDLEMDRAGNLWITAGGALTRFDGKHFKVFLPGKEIPITARTVYEDRDQNLWVAGLGGVVQFSNGKFIPRVPWSELTGDLITRLMVDPKGNLWIGGSEGIVEVSPDNEIRKFSKDDGLPDNFVRAIWLDSDGNLWAGTNSGLARLHGDRFRAEGPAGLIRCLYEDTEHDLWVGSNSGLSRLKDDTFTVFGKSEGLPSDSPNTIFEDRDRRLWVGYHDNALLLISQNGYRTFNARDGLPEEEIFSIKQSRTGDMLLSGRGGFVRMSAKGFKTFMFPDAFGRKYVFDSLEDSNGRLWLASSNGVAQLIGDKLRPVIPGGPLGSSAVVTLFQSRDGVLWAGTYQMGLWRFQGDEKRQFTTNDGLSSNHIRLVLQDSDGILWIATFGGGLNMLRSGTFHHFTTKDGLISDNIANIVDDGSSLWLSTTRGICRVPKAQLRALLAGKITRLQPMNYGVENGLRSAQAAPGFPIAGGGIKASDGRLWFPTSNGLAVIDPNAEKRAQSPPRIRLQEVLVDGKPIALSRDLKLSASSNTVQIRYSAIHLSAPERVEYSYKLDGVDGNWVDAEHRRETGYNSLDHGKYRFTVRASLGGGAASEETYDFEKLPKFYETLWFRLLALASLFVGVWGAYQMRVRQLRYRFTLVLEERVRIAREIHDTLAQGFIGISSQLEAVSCVLPNDGSSARAYLDMARKMARHSVTEARRAVSDLRTSLLESGDLAMALRSGTQIWTSGSDVVVEIDAPDTSSGAQIPHEFEQHLLRITQEAVTNVVKHASASKILVTLNRERSLVRLRIVDDGCGFRQQDPLSPMNGHFGLIGMRERTQRLGGTFQLLTGPGEGTRIEVTCPLP
jgi:signal transduction histidine kinase/ligand-binding sensor domain-containing protein